MILAHKILRQLPVIVKTLLFHMVVGVELLKQQIADVLLVFQHFHDHAGIPQPAQRRGHAFLCQQLHDFHAAHALQIHLKNSANHRGFLRLNGKAAVSYLVAVHSKARGNTLLEFLSDAPFAVFGYAAALLLCKRSEDGQHKLTVPAQRIQLLFLKINAYAQPLQLAHRIQQRQRIPGETGDGLDQNQVDLSFAAFFQHPLKFRARFLRSGQTKIREYPCILPFGVSLDPFAVIADLRRQRVQHGVLFHGDAGISCHALSHRQLRRRFHAGERHCLLVHFNPSLLTLYQSFGS